MFKLFKNIYFHIVMLIMVIMSSGCATDNAYNVAKVGYIVGKQVVVANENLLSEDTITNLKKLDTSVEFYDGSRSAFIDAIEISKKKEKVVQ